MSNLRDRVLALIHEHGVKRAARMLHLSPEATLRLALDLPHNEATAVLAQQRLDGMRLRVIGGGRP